MLQRGHPPAPAWCPSRVSVSVFPPPPPHAAPAPLPTRPHPTAPHPSFAWRRAGAGSAETRSGPSDTHRAGDIGATDGKRDKSPPQTAVPAKVVLPFSRIERFAVNFAKPGQSNLILERLLYLWYRIRRTVWGALDPFNQRPMLRTKLCQQYEDEELDRDQGLTIFHAEAKIQTLAA
ncbi:hypothetical protein AB1E19_005083 [Capra hircus]